MLISFCWLDTNQSHLVLGWASWEMVFKACLYNSNFYSTCNQVNNVLQDHLQLLSHSAYILYTQPVQNESPLRTIITNLPILLCFGHLTVPYPLSFLHVYFRLLTQKNTTRSVLVTGLVQWKHTMTKTSLTKGKHNLTGGWTDTVEEQSQIPAGDQAFKYLCLWGPFSTDHRSKTCTENMETLKATVLPQVRCKQHWAQSDNIRTLFWVGKARKAIFSLARLL